MGVDDAMKNMDPVKEKKALEHAKERQQTEAELRELCQEIDVEGHGKLTYEGWVAAIGRYELRSYLNMMDFRASEVMHFVEMMCKESPDGQVDIHTFVKGCMRFRGPASCFDMQNVLSAVRECTRHLELQEQALEQLVQANRSTSRTPSRLSRGLPSGD